MLRIEAKSLHELFSIIFYLHGVVDLKVSNSDKIISYCDFAIALGSKSLLNLGKSSVTANVKRSVIS